MYEKLDKRIENEFILFILHLCLKCTDNFTLPQHKNYAKQIPDKRWFSKLLSNFTTVILWHDPMLMKDMTSFFPVAASSVYDPVKMSKTSIRRWGRDKHLKAQEQNLNNEHGDSEWTGVIVLTICKVSSNLQLKTSLCTNQSELTQV